MTDEQGKSGEVVHSGLLLSPKEEDHWEMGQGIAARKFGGDVNPSGNWTSSLPIFEAQSRPAFETNGCVVFGTLKAYITLAKFLGFFDFTKDASERYSGVWAGTNQYGTDPHVMAEQLRKVAGLVPQEIMPWTDDITTLDKYYDKELGKTLLSLGKSLLSKFEFGNEWVFSYGSKYTPEEKTALLEAALKRGTVCVSVNGHYRTRNSAYYKNPGDQDTHWVLLTRLERGARIVDDQYAPFIKRFEKDYDHDAAKVYFLQRKDETTKTFWNIVWDNFSKLWATY